MQKITQKVLFERGTPETSKLDQIKTLNLSQMELKSTDLPVSLLSRLCRLERLDLSGNRLQELPRGLTLPCLRVLDCSNNDMEDVTSLQDLGSLEELRLEDNLYLTVNDEHKAMFLLPNLRIFNGKDVSATARHIRYVSSEILRKRVEMIAKEHLRSLTGSGEKQREAETLAGSKENGAENTPAKRKSCDLGTDGNAGGSVKRAKTNGEAVAEASPRKSNRLANAAVPEASPRKSSRLQGTPQKVSQTTPSPRKALRMNDAPTAEDSPRKSSRLQGTPQKNGHVAASPRKVPKSQSISNGKPIAGEESQSKKPRDHSTSQQGRQTRTPTKTGTSAHQETDIKSDVPKEPACLRPIHVLQCHSKDDSPEDFRTQLWACAFEPSQDNRDASGWTHTVATCGGDSVCVIDCETGRVLKKYKVPGEEFFSVAWSTVMMSREVGGLRPCSILAAAGKRGVVKLIHPRANLAYGEFRASRRAVSILRFSPRRASFLFTGAYDNKVIMWDIGGVDRDYNFKVSQLLVLETSSTPLQLCLPPSSPDTHLMTACEDGLYCFDTQLSKNTQKKAEKMEIVFPVYKKKDKTGDYRTIDGLGFLSDDIVASKSHMQGSIYLWSWNRTWASRPGKKREVPAVILAELQWASTDIPYLSLSTCPDYGYVVCGDEKGRLWTYHITESMKSKFKSGKVIPATEVLEWPSPVRTGMSPIEGPSINNVAMDPELRYLVALSDKNMAVIWRREDV
ncbi:leucine-rich repeat and WD repeat-containing protein 1 [Chanos chanos]|uniref:Leucine-rich repeat and WD repeat-containing protein 1 n=1 Tax=Chanos chanos TaxID=29144 RepID=A0A6J2WWZ2_CHACN|nr:leucine-rich repeat and WD repeat-containing protein 1 [Chanos chanos]